MFSAMRTFCRSGSRFHEGRKSMKKTRTGSGRLKLPDNFLGTVRAFLNTPRPPRGRPPTYKAIQAEVRKADGFVAQTCWIADVLRQMGYPVKDAHNRKGAKPVKPCPVDKVVAIKSAIKKLTV